MRAGQRGGRQRLLGAATSRARSSPSSTSPCAARSRIARRLQDPLAELVKIDPKAIGVGQYQHDVHQPLLARKLDEVVESCVNQVGVELNTASAPLLVARRRHRPGRWRRRSSRTATRNGAFASRARAARRCPASARRPSSRPPASCASATRPTTRSTPAPCTPSATRSSSAWPRDLGVDAGRAGRQPGALARLDLRALRRATTSASRRCATSSPSCASPAAIRAPASSRRSFRDDVHDDRGPQARA